MKKTDLKTVLTMSAAAPGQPKEAVLSIFDAIGTGFNEFSSKHLSAHLEQLKNEDCRHLTLRINSPGGNVFEALAMYDMLQASGLELRAEVYGLAASAATVLALACPVIALSRSCSWMVHEPSICVEGNLFECRARLQSLEQVRDRIFDIYSEAVKKPRAMVEADHANEKWYTAESAIAYGWPVSVLNAEEDEKEDSEGSNADSEGTTGASDEEADGSADPEGPAEPGFPPKQEQGHDLDPDDGKPAAGDDEEEDKPSAGIVSRVLKMLGVQLKEHDAPTAGAISLEKNLAAAKAEAAGAREHLAQNLKDMKAMQESITARVNQAVADALAARAYAVPPLPAPQKNVPPCPSKEELAAAAKAGGVAGLLARLKK